MERLTVFTPTYNRAELLQVAFDALKRQTCKDFIWMVIDDGSTDDTRNVVSQWQNEDCGFCVEYYYKDNGGLQTAYVEAIKHIKTELCMCVDSDDFLMDDAVERLIKFWIENGSNDVAGIVSLNKYPNGNIAGGRFPHDMRTVNFRKIVPGMYGRTNNDIVMMYRTVCYGLTTPAKQYPNERSLNATRQFIQIAQKYDMLIYNEPTVIVNYQADGISNNKFRAYMKSPNCFADFRLFSLSIDGCRSKSYFRMGMHYVAECKIAKRRVFVKELKRKRYVLFAYPMGIAWYIYLKRNAEKTNCLDFTLEKSGKEKGEGK